jgi:predicted DNA-binding protein (UPF0278 family)
VQEQIEELRERLRSREAVLRRIVTARDIDEILTAVAAADVVVSADAGFGASGANTAPGGESPRRGRTSSAS